MDPKNLKNTKKSWKKQPLGHGKVQKPHTQAIPHLPTGVGIYITTFEFRASKSCTLILIKKIIIIPTFGCQILYYYFFGGSKVKILLVNDMLYINLLQISSRESTHGPITKSFFLPLVHVFGFLLSPGPLHFVWFKTWILLLVFGKSSNFGWNPKSKR